MIDETANPAAEGPTGPAERKQEPVTAFCQQCGRPLTSSSERRVGGGVFCDPCAAVRVAQPSGWAPVNAGVTPAYPGQAANLKATGEPNPVLAGVLGLIPGVGAMYNGQYAKGVIHLIVFVVLVSLADNLNWVLWWLVWGWIFYQAFEAYHTAQAQRDGQPLPDPFGWNELGDRFGFARSSPARPWAQRPSAAPVSPAPPPSSGATWQQTTPPGGTGPFAEPLAVEKSAMPSYPAASSFASATAGTFHGGNPAAYSATPYAPTFTGAAPVPEQPPLAAGFRRFPAGAAWLIGLGVLFLCGNLLPDWHIDGRWLVPILLAGIALWTGAQRILTTREVRSASAAGTYATPIRTNLAGALFGPILLLTVALLLAFHDAGVLPLRHSWPAVLIVWGALLLLQRIPDSGTTEDPVPAATAPSAADSPLR